MSVFRNAAFSVFVGLAFASGCTSGTGGVSSSSSGSAASSSGGTASSGGSGGACAADHACGSGAVCDRAALACVSCRATVDCGFGAVCLGGECRAGTPCSADPDCTAPTPRCDVVFGRCVECLGDLHCAAPADRCAGRTCRQRAGCLTTPGCSNQRTCDAAANDCVDCGFSALCPGDQVCLEGGLCAPRACYAGTCATAGPVTAALAGSLYSGMATADGVFVQDSAFRVIRAYPSPQWTHPLPSTLVRGDPAQPAYIIESNGVSTSRIWQWANGTEGWTELGVVGAAGATSAVLTSGGAVYALFINRSPEQVWRYDVNSGVAERVLERSGLGAAALYAAGSRVYLRAGATLEQLQPNGTTDPINVQLATGALAHDGGFLYGVDASGDLLRISLQTRQPETLRRMYAPHAAFLGVHGGTLLVQPITLLDVEAHDLATGEHRVMARLALGEGPAVLGAAALHFVAGAAIWTLPLP